MTGWHVPSGALREFATQPRSLDSVRAASIEAHVASCRECQAGVAAETPPSEIDTVWVEVVDQIDRTSGTLSERWIRWVGLDSGAARLIAATPALRAGALAAVGLVVAAIVLASRSADANGVFLAVAPIVPTALVALSFAPGADPAGECGVATPVYGIGLLMRRAVVVEVIALALLSAGTALLPLHGWASIAWLLPALAISLGTLAAGARWPAPQAAAAFTLVWVALVAVATWSDGRQSISGSVLFDPVGQVVTAVAVAIALFVIVHNRQIMFQEVR